LTNSVEEKLWKGKKKGFKSPWIYPETNNTGISSRLIDRDAERQKVL
jgi:hypothetical protein